MCVFVRACLATKDILVDQSEWLQGPDGLHLRNTLTYITVPDDDYVVHQFTLSTDDGLFYTRTLQLPILRKNKTVYTVPSGISMQDYSSNAPEVARTRSLNVTIVISSPESLGVKVLKYSLSPQPPQIGDNLIAADKMYTKTMLHDDNMAAILSPLVQVFHSELSQNNDTNRTTMIGRYRTVVNVIGSNATTGGDLFGRYVISFESTDEKLEIISDALETGQHSLFPAGALRFEIAACDPQSQRRPGSFEFAEDLENCVVCTAGGNPRPEVTLYHDGFPMGSWLGHSVYTYFSDKDTTSVQFILADPFSGSFSCLARLSDDDPGTAVKFDITVPGEV